MSLFLGCVMCRAHIVTSQLTVGPPPPLLPCLQLWSTASSRRLLPLVTEMADNPLRRLSSLGSSATLLNMRVLLPPSAGYTASVVAATINANSSALSAAVQVYLRGLAQPVFAASVASLSSAAPAAALPPIVPRGPAPVATTTAADASPNPALSPLLMGLAIGFALAVFIALWLAVVLLVRAAGPCCGLACCCEPLATCCGAWPLAGRQRRRDFISSFKEEGRGRGAQPAFASVVNPLAGALALRAINDALQGAAPGSPPPPLPPRVIRVERVAVQSDEDTLAQPAGVAAVAYPASPPAAARVLVGPDGQHVDYRPGYHGQVIGVSV